ncbi:cilia- and flagella-associated protein 251-like [Diabrotica virgifera virgifera]|uniref:Golgin subfamily A member 6-like protein 22 n=1 Tax=Diabrotica virgifera virgifera TaxID=50390 RepID=A0ABM5KCL6_DIAVI|nr:cilia- and flagella-associated protein 251-like [Diabrotica virgifera virgifera]
MGEERPQDGRTEEEEQRKFEKEMLEWREKQPKMNRSGPPKHSTLVGDDLLKEINKEEENEGDKMEEDPSVEIVKMGDKEVERREEEQGESYWQDIEESVLTAFLFDEADREEIQQNKKRKGDSLEMNEKFKREKREESKKYSEETENERVQRKLKEVLEILNGKGPIEGENKAKARKLIGEITSIQNKTSQNQNQTVQEEGHLKCEQCKIKMEQERQKKETEKIIKALNKGGDINNFSQIYKKKWEEKSDIKKGGVESVIRTIREDVYEIIEGCKEENVEYIENVKKSSMASERREWFTYVVKIKKHGMYEMAERAIKQIKERETPPQTIRVIINNEINQEEVRKALEFVGRGENIIWELVIRGKEMDKGARHEQQEALIKTGGKKYTDVLKEMNEKINIGKIGVKVDRLKKTEGGDILVKLKGKGAADKLRKEMDTRMSGLNMAVRRKENHFTITGMDLGSRRRSYKTL